VFEERPVPLIIVQYTANIDTDMTALCQKMATTLLSIRDEHGAQVYPEGGLKVMAYPSAHYAVGDGQHDDHAFMYFNLRIVEGRSAAVVKETGDRIMDTIREHIEPVFSRSPIGITFHVELQPIEKPQPIIMAYEGRHNNLRAIYGR
jgi:5-carboxymethyl-2-hydroxymuconate isomerase